MPVVIADLSSGLEAKKLPVVVDNFNFEYICGLEIGPELNGLFSKNGTLAKTNRQQVTAKMPPPLLTANLDFEVFNAGGGKGWGLRSVQQIDQPNLALFEYCGVLKLADGHDDGIVEDDYIFEFEYNDHRFLLDANAKGNLARFCNHSCEPNCYTRLAVFGNENANEALPRLLICTKRPIQKGEELTLDYGQGWWEAKSALNCACGTENCKFNGIPGEDVRMLEDKEEEEDEDEDEEEEDEEEEEEEEDEEEENRDMPIHQTARKSCGGRGPSRKSDGGIVYGRKSCGGRAPYLLFIDQTARKSCGGRAPARKSNGGIALSRKSTGGIASGRKTDGNSTTNGRIRQTARKACPPYRMMETNRRWSNE